MNLGDLWTNSAVLAARSGIADDGAELVIWRKSGHQRRPQAAVTIWPLRNSNPGRYPGVFTASLLAEVRDGPWPSRYLMPGLL
jgi:hypothetical protein